MRVGQRTDEHALNYGKHGGVCADAKRKCQHSQRGKSRRVTKLPKREAQILKKCLHFKSPGSLSSSYLSRGMRSEPVTVARTAIYHKLRALSASLAPALTLASGVAGLRSGKGGG